MAAMEPVDVNNGESDDSSTSPQSPSITPTTVTSPTDGELKPPDYSSEEEDEYFTASEDEDEDSRLESIDEQFKSKLKELLSQAFSDQVDPHSVEAFLQHTAKTLLQHLSNTYSLTWMSQIKIHKEDDELLLWVLLMRRKIARLGDLFQRQMDYGFAEMMHGMLPLYHHKQ